MKFPILPLQQICNDIQHIPLFKKVFTFNIYEIQPQFQEKLGTFVKI